MSITNKIFGLDNRPRPLLAKEIWDDSYQTAAHIRSAAMVVDIGANIGMYSIWAVDAGAKHVIAIEPFSENVEKLKANLERCGMADNVTVLDAAVGAAGATECAVLVRGEPDEIEVRSTGIQTIPGTGCPSID